MFITNVDKIQEYYVEYCLSHITLLWVWNNVMNVLECCAYYKQQVYLLSVEDIFH